MCDKLSEKEVKSMKKYERNLKKLISLSNGGCDLVPQETAGLTEEELRFLSAKGFVELNPAGDNLFWIWIEPSGLAYFSNKEEARSQFIKTNMVNFFSGFVSGVLVTVTAAWIIQTVL